MRRSGSRWIEYIEEEFPLTQARIAGTLEQFIRRQFSVAETDGRFTHAAPLFDLGYIDSIGSVELLAFIGKEWDVQVSDEDLLSEQFTTIDGIASIIYRVWRASSTPQQAQPAPAGALPESARGVPAR